MAEAKTISRRVCKGCGHLFDDPPYPEPWPRGYCTAECWKAAKKPAKLDNHAMRRQYKPKLCVVCGTEFVPRNGIQKYCSKACTLEGQWTERICAGCGQKFKRPAHTQIKACSPKCAALARYGPPEIVPCLWCGKHFKRTGRRKDRNYCDQSCAAQYRWAHQPKALRKWNLANKGEDACRNCGRSAVHLHHIVPRSKTRAGREDIERNGIPLCSDCHRGWHNRRVTIYRGCLTPEEADNAALLAGRLWLDQHYPIPGDVQLVEMAALAGSNLQPGWQGRNAERIATARDLRHLEDE